MFGYKEDSFEKFHVDRIHSIWLKSPMIHTWRWHCAALYPATGSIDKYFQSTLVHALLSNGCANLSNSLHFKMTHCHSSPDVQTELVVLIISRMSAAATCMTWNERRVLVGVDSDTLWVCACRLCILSAYPYYYNVDNATHVDNAYAYMHKHFHSLSPSFSRFQSVSFVRRNMEKI